MRTMRRSAFLVLLVILPVTLSADPVTLSGSVRARAENWEFFEAPGYDDSYTFFGAILRASAAQKVNANFAWQVDVAAPALTALPDRAAAPPPFGQLGLGASYYAANDGDETSVSVFPKQAFVRFTSGGTSLRAGRFEWAEGNEVVPENAMLVPLKSARVAQRLIGPFAFTHVGRSFDGLHLIHEFSSFNVTLVGARPTVGAFDTSGLEEVDDVTFYYGSLNYSRPDADERLFAIHYSDDRGLVKTDNRPAPTRNLDRGEVSITTLGGHYLAAFGPVDVLLWGAWQTGEWGMDDHRADAIDVEAGYHFDDEMKPVVRAGLFRSSGDGDALDGEHETFFQILPTPRLYARFPFYNAMNSTDAFVQFSFKPSKKTTVATELHMLSLTESADLWYAGGGAFEDETFGFAGRPSSGRDELARVVDLSVDYAWTPKTSFTFYGAFAAGDDVVDSIFAGSGGRYLYFEVTRKF